MQESALDIFVWMLLYAHLCLLLVTEGPIPFLLKELKDDFLHVIERQEWNLAPLSLVYTCGPSPHFTRVHSDDLHSLLSSRFPPHMVPPHHSLHTTGIPHPAIVTPNVKQESSHSDISSLNSS